MKELVQYQLLKKAVSVNLYNEGTGPIPAVKKAVSISLYHQGTSQIIVVRIICSIKDADMPS